MRSLVVGIMLCTPVALLGAEGFGWQVPFFPAKDRWVSDPVALSEDLVFASGNDGALVAIGIASGEQAWRFQVGTPDAASNVVSSRGLNGLQGIADAVAGTISLRSPTWHSPLVYLGSSHAQPEDLPNFYAIDGQSGIPRWSFFAPGGVDGSAIAAGNRVIVVGQRMVYSLDAATGQAHWSFEPLAGLHEASRRPPTTPVVDGDSVYLTVWPFHRFDAPEHSYLYALDTGSGEQRWTVDVPGDDVTAAVVHGDLVFFAVREPTVRSVEAGAIVESGGDATLVYAVNKGDGAIQWTAAIENTDLLLTMVPHDGLLYIDMLNGFGQGDNTRVLALNAETGAEAWSLQDWLLLPAMPIGTEVYGWDERSVAALNPQTGRPQRELPLKDDTVWGMAGGQWLYASKGNRVSSYDVATGKQRWQRRLDSNVVQVLPGSDFVVVVTGGEDIVGQVPQPGAIYRLDAATGDGA
jgi:outer membrane protein assembly factor BamB